MSGRGVGNASTLQFLDDSCSCGYLCDLTMYKLEKFGEFIGDLYLYDYNLSILMIA